MTFANTTERYEDWLCKKLVIDKAELVDKRRAMRENEHAFLRGTFYRWATVWQKHCKKLDGAPEVLGIGDIHVENFGTWRDADGRLAWGVNDFDEASPIPYTADLVRLATSAMLAEAEIKRKKDTKLSDEIIAEVILDGYKSGIVAQEPFVLAEQHSWLRKLVAAAFEVEDKNGHTRYQRFVEQMQTLPAAPGLPTVVGEIIRDAFPKPVPIFTVGHRIAGLGSLGRQRYTAVSRNWYGGIIVRETKALTTSAWEWARGDENSNTIHYNRIIRAAQRSPDPTLQVRGGWVTRRLAPDVGKVEIQDLPIDSGQELLRSMAKEIANVHCPSGQTLRDIQTDIESRAPGWLLDAAREMRDRVHEDWEEFKSAKD